MSLSLNQLSMNRFILFPLLLFYSSLQSTPLALAFTLVDSSSKHIFQDILREISERQNWDPDAAAANSTLRVSEIRFGISQRYDFRIRFGKSPLLFKFPDEVDTWNKLNRQVNDFGSFVKEFNSSAQLDTLKVDGPFDLRVGGKDELALSLPLNVSHSGLKRLLVGEGITVEVRGAEELSLFHTFDHNFTVNGNETKRTTGAIPFWQLWCTPLLPIHVIGCASLIAYRTNNPNAPIETTLLAEGTLELLPAKCYNNNENKNKAQISHFLTSKIDRLGRLLRTFLTNTMLKDMSSGLFRVHVKASTVIKFGLEVEKKVGSNETRKSLLEEWRTRPTVERLWFEVMARIEAEKLRPVTVKKVRPFIAVDSDSWSNLMFNISFTKFPSILVPSESLTLDVKW